MRHKRTSFSFSLNYFDVGGLFLAFFLVTHQSETDMHLKREFGGVCAMLEIRGLNVELLSNSYRDFRQITNGSSITRMTA